MGRKPLRRPDWIVQNVIINMSETDKKYWKGLEEPNEMPDPIFFEGSGSKLSATRRDFLKLMGFSFGSAALAACTRMPVEKAIPFLVKPEEITPGVANWYATTCAGCTASCGLLVKVRDGRPIKIEGNELSPLSRGGVCAVGQATVLSLYDDARLRGPLLDGKDTSWEELDARVAKEFGNIAAQGGKIVLLTQTIVSPSTRALIVEWLEKFQGSRHVVYEPVSLSAIPAANEKNFRRRVLPHYRFDRAKMIVGCNADFLGTWISPVEFARGYSLNRKPPSLSRHVQFESRMSLTGTNADLRVPVAPSEEGAVILALLREVSRLADTYFSSTVPSLSIDEKIIRETAKDLWKNRGASLVISGTNSEPIQSAVNALNSLLGNIGETVDLDNPSFQKQGSDEEMKRLIEEMNRGEVRGLILYGVNPIYDDPEPDLFATGLKKVVFSVSFADRLDETSSLVRGVAPDSHFLESWNDAEPVAGIFSFTQPTIRPIGATRSAQESLLKWMGRTENYYDFLRSRWGKDWETFIHDGVFSGAEKTPKKKWFSGDLPALVVASPEKGQFELELYEKMSIRDGRHANNPWLQELPDPVTKITWGNYLQIAPSTATALGLVEGDIVQLTSPEGALRGRLDPALPVEGATRAPVTITLPVQVQPGQSPKAVSVAVGYGRMRCGKVGEKVGVNAYPFLAVSSGVVLEKTGRHVELAATQTHHSMEGRPIIKEATLADYVKNPRAGNEEHENLISLWAEKEKNGHAWGMAIDLTNCIGCSACIVSCQAENNVAVVGKDEVRRRREMHWIRIDRYYNGDENNPETVHQPMMCQHCDNAPCETVCPVLATTHSSDGLNQQVYNRCVGTRYCANNCPYKVRRFNWFDYAHNRKFDYNMNSELGEMVLNPDIVVRSRGVMEKCSMCIQRIQEGKLQANREEKVLKDGDIRLACEQSCPTQAIIFGDLNDSESRASKLNQDGRFYHVLEELNVRPVVGYLTKVRNKE